MAANIIFMKLNTDNTVTHFLSEHICVEGLEIYTPSQIMTMVVPTVLLSYILLPKVLSSWGIFSSRYPFHILPSVMYVVTMRQSLKCSQALQSDDLECKLKFMLVCLEKHSCASSGKVLIAKNERSPNTMFPCNKEALSIHMGFVLVFSFCFTLLKHSWKLWKRKTARNIHITS